MPFDPEILKETHSKEHEALLKTFRDSIEKSRKSMAKNYERWDEHDGVFRSFRKLDKEDRKSVAEGKPSKMVVPLSKAQVMTFVAFSVMTVTQNRRFFELEPTGKQDNPLSEPMELILERDTRRNKWSAFLVQFFLDLGRFGLGAAEVCWEEQTRKLRVPSVVPQDVMGAQVDEQKIEYVDMPFFVGNRVYPVSPYRFFPDTALPITRYQEGEFCGSEDFFTLSMLQSIPGTFNLDKIPKYDKDQLDKRTRITRGDFTDFQVRLRYSGDGPDKQEGAFVQEGTVLVTKVVKDIIPSKTKINGDTTLGKEDFPVRYLCWYANDKTIIKFEAAYWLHGQFPWICAQFMPDQHQTVNEGLADDCGQIAGIITWLTNAHVRMSRNNVDSKYVVDPAIIDVKSLDQPSPYIFVKRGAGLGDVKRGIQQFDVRPPNPQFMNEVEGFRTMLEYVTGYGNYMVGQNATGRRSATEAKVVTQGGASRGKLTLYGVWDTAFEPLAKQFLANNRQEMDFDTFQRILGSGPFGATDPITGMEMPIEQLFTLFKSDPVSIAMSEDFFVFDGTQPSEKAFMAQSLQEMLTALLSNPVIMQILGYPPEALREMINQIYILRGVTPPRLPVQQTQALPPGVVPMQQPGAQAPGGVPTTPVAGAASA